LIRSSDKRVYKRQHKKTTRTSFRFNRSNRVTRLGKFSPNYSPNVWLFTLGSYLKLTEVSHIFGLLYYMDKF
jgi:hypothetical protein